mmetsp:Transcript_17050/g.45529  ORF Transcript_17050/g.45529 Transcript_17050/m.45529 type:complete len:237 (+) Transcript_17050:2-712(+)
MWDRDLEAMLKCLDELEAQEAEEERSMAEAAEGRRKKDGTKGKRGPATSKPPATRAKRAKTDDDDDPLLKKPLQAGVAASAADTLKRQVDAVPTAARGRPPRGALVPGGPEDGPAAAAKGQPKEDDGLGSLASRLQRKKRKGADDDDDDGGAAPGGAVSSSAAAPLGGSAASALASLLSSSRSLGSGGDLPALGESFGSGSLSSGGDDMFSYLKLPPPLFEIGGGDGGGSSGSGSH